MNLKAFFKRKPDKFVALLIQQTDLMVAELGALTVYMEKRSSKVAKQIAQTENEADEVRRILIAELMKTFVTPYDREDIFTLSREIDDVLDYAYTTVDEMEILDVEPTAYMQQMAKLLHDASIEIKLAVERLQEEHYTVSNDHTQRAKALENKVESVYREALSHLFKETTNVKHVVNMLKVREIYRHLSNAADREDDAANIISDIVMKVG
jgi:predicted phosphate transport protein (TIGR00153 family)